MNFAISTAGGMAMTLVNICKIPAPPGPPIPTPLPSIGQAANVKNPVAEVMAQNKPLVTEGGEMPMSDGDQAGTAGGMSSGTFGQKVVISRGSSVVKAKGKPVGFHTTMTDQNKSNMPAGNFQVPTPGMTVFVGP